MHSNHLHLVAPKLFNGHIKRCKTSCNKQRIDYPKKRGTKPLLWSHLDWLIILLFGGSCRRRLMSGTMQTSPYMPSSIKPSGIKLRIRIKPFIKKSKNYVEKSGILRRSVFIRCQQTTIREKRRLNFTLTYLQMLTDTCVRKWLWKRRAT